MKRILLLLKLQIDNKFDILKTKNPKAMLPALVKYAVLLMLASLALSFGISEVVNIGIIVNRELLAIILLAVQLVSVVFAIGNVIKTLYMSKDNELLICLPVTPNQLFVSKILMIYIREFAVNAAMLIPLFLVLGSFARFGASSFGVEYYLSIIPLLLLLPIIPIVISAFLSIPIMAVVKFLKKHPLLAILVIFSSVAACLWVYIGFIGTFVSDFDIVNKQYETVRRLNGQIFEIGQSIFLYYRLSGVLVSFSEWHFFPIFALGCVAVFALTILFTRYFFFKTAMSSIENTIRTVKVKTSLKKKSPLASLFTKEVLCVFRSPSDVFEYFLFTLLMPFIVFSCDRLLMSITDKVNLTGINMIAAAHVMVVAILAMLSNISSASVVSRDGGNFYFSKIIPVNYFTQIFAKFFFNAVFTIGALIVTAIISCFIYPVWQIVLGTLAVAMAAIGHIAYSIDTDIKHPTVFNGGDENSTAISKSTPKSLVYGLAVGFIMGCILIFMSYLENALLPYILINVLAFIFMIYRVYTLILRINLRYDKIEM